MASFDRGFKSWTEKTAASFRRDLEISPSAPLPPKILAQYLNIEIWEPKDVQQLSQKDLNQLLVNDNMSWSAVTIRRGDKYTIISNPTHSTGRIASDLMHELSHIVAGHEPAKMILSADGGIAMRTFDPKQEDEANWLSGGLLLPRIALLHIHKTRLTEHQACALYGVSSDLLNYRLNVTGVNFQFKSRFPRRPPP